MIRASSRSDALGRHPSASGWRPDLRRMTDAMAEVFAREGRPHAAVAAAVQSARGRSGETVGEFAGRLGLSVPWLTRLESGDVSAEVIPTVITAEAPWIDWSSLRST